MKTKDAKEKRFRELSDEELQNVTGGARRPPIAPGALIASGDEVEARIRCVIPSCPPGYHIDMDSCQCVEEPNAGGR